MNRARPPDTTWERTPMLLHTLLRQFDAALRLEQIPNVQVSGIQEDSRKVRPGNVFIARPGTKSDGATYAADAQAKGAVAVVTPQAITGCSLPQVIIPDPASAASHLANIFYGRP